MRLYLGLDLGTSGCRAVVIDQNGVIQAFSESEIAAPVRKDKRVEQDPLTWWTVVKQVLAQACAQVDSRTISAIAVDGTSASVLLINNSGQPQTPALMYNDARADEQALQIQAVATDHGVDAGGAAAPSSSLAKLCWWLKKHPNAERYKICHQSDWIAGQLCHHFGVSDSNNCLKLGYDARQHTWPEWLQALSVPSKMLPTVQLPGSIIAPICADVANEFNLASNTQIVAGTTDSTASVIATGATELGDAITTLGSTLVIKTLSDQPYSSSQYGVYSQPLFDRWLVGGASNSGGAVLKHYFSDQQIQTLSTQIDPHVDTGLEYYPLLVAGERFPISDSNYAPRLSPRPDNELRFFQAILEGIAKIEKIGYDRLASLGAPYPTRVISMGGGAKNSRWCQMREKLLGVPVSTAEISDAAYGAALLARLKAPTNN